MKKWEKPPLGRPSSGKSGRAKVTALYVSAEKKWILEELNQLRESGEIKSVSEAFVMAIELWLKVEMGVEPKKN